jgi:hypothetical protein
VDTSQTGSSDVALEVTLEVLYERRPKPRRSYQDRWDRCSTPPFFWLSAFCCTFCTTIIIMAIVEAST